MKFEIKSFAHGTWIPQQNCFGIPTEDGKSTFGQNLNPHLVWSDAPVETKSYVIICVDKDVPSIGVKMNVEGQIMETTIPRVDFFHWVLIDIPKNVNEIIEGAHTKGVTIRGKKPGVAIQGIQGINSYTMLFANDDELSGVYGGYDGPCPPWNDDRIHTYQFQIFALDVETLNLSGNFDANDVYKAMDGHILDKSLWLGLYSLNKKYLT